MFAQEFLSPLYLFKYNRGILMAPNCIIDNGVSKPNYCIDFFHYRHDDYPTILINKHL